MIGDNKMLIDDYLSYLHEQDEDEEEKTGFEGAEKEEEKEKEEAEEEFEKDEDEDEDEDDEDEVEESDALFREKLNIVRKAKLIMADPFKKREVAKALKRKRAAIKKFDKAAYKKKVMSIKQNVPKGDQKKKLAQLKKDKDRQIALIVRTREKLRQAEKARKWRKRTATGVGLAGVGATGFGTAKRSDIKGQSL